MQSWIKNRKVIDNYMANTFVEYQDFLAPIEAEEEI